MTDDLVKSDIVFISYLKHPDEVLLKAYKSMLVYKKHQTVWIREENCKGIYNNLFQQTRFSVTVHSNAECSKSSSDNDRGEDV